MRGGFRVKGILCTLFLLAFLIVYGCASMKESKPIGKLDEYERLLVGRFDANYVGTKTCLAACHAHDKIRRDFEASTMGAQLSGKSGLPIVDCESCHGPGSLAIEGITPEKVAEDEKQGIKTQCKYETLIELKTLPVAAQSLLCLKCHSANATFNLHAWSAGAHAAGDVACFSCHNVHAGPDLIVSPNETASMCLKCHEKTRAEFLQPSHHPVLENKIHCTDCHDPHGTMSDGLLREDTIKETCVKCHAEKEGPFLMEHADLNEDCGACHKPHGSAARAMLKAQEPFLCLQCHVGHRTTATETNPERKVMFYNRCSDCHSTIHGTDTPSVSGRGLFTR